MALQTRTQIKSYLDANVNTNGVRDITGAEMNSALTDLLDSSFVQQAWVNAAVGGGNMDLGAVASNYINVTGTGIITSFGTVGAGVVRWLKFASNPIIAESANIITGFGDMQTAAGGRAMFVSEGAGNWRLLHWLKADGKSAIPPTWTEVTSKPTVFPPDTHTHVAADITDFLSGGHDFTAAMSIVVAGTGVAWLLESTTAPNSAVGPTLALRRSGTPASSTKSLGSLAFQALDSLGVNTNYARVRSRIVDETDGNETAQLILETNTAGTLGAVLTLDAGAAVGTALDMGANTLNAGTLYEAGVSLATTYATIASLGDLAFEDVIAAGNIPAGLISNGKLADMVTATVKMRVTGTTGAPQDGTMAQLKTALVYVFSDLGGTITNAQIPVDTIGLTKITVIPTARFLGNVSGITAAVDALTVAQLKTAFVYNFTDLAGTLANSQIAADTIGLVKLANIADLRLLGNISGASGPVTALTADQIKAGASIAEADLFKCLTTGENGQNINTVQPVFPTNGAVTLEASTTYFFEGLYLITRAAGTTSHTTAVSFGGTATLTSIAFSVVAKTSVGAALTAMSGHHFVAAAGGVVTAASVSATENLMILVRGTVRVNAAGTFIPRFTYSAVPGGVPTILANTFFLLTKVGSNVVASKGTWA